MVKRNDARLLRPCSALRETEVQWVEDNGQQRRPCQREEEHAEHEVELVEEKEETGEEKCREKRLAGHQVPHGNSPIEW